MGRKKGFQSSEKNIPWLEILMAMGMTLYTYIPELKREMSRWWSAFLRRKRTKRERKRHRASLPGRCICEFSDLPAQLGSEKKKFPEIFCPGILQAAHALQRTNIALYPSFLIRVLSIRVSLCSLSNLFSLFLFLSSPSCGLFLVI